MSPTKSAYKQGKMRGTELLGGRNLSFFSLPLEIRLVVYDMLEHVVPRYVQGGEMLLLANGAPKTERLDLICHWDVTRRSLRLTCKAVEKEWTPFFFRSTTICLDHSRDPWQFGDVYLRNLDHDVITNIRRVEYEGSRHGHPEDLYRPEQPAYETRALQEIRNVVQRYEKHLRLESVTIKLMGLISADLITPLLRQSRTQATATCVDFKRLEEREIFPRDSLTCFAREMLAGPFAGASVRSFAVSTGLQVTLWKSPPVREEVKEKENSNAEDADADDETSDFEREDDFVSEDEES